MTQQPEQKIAVDPQRQLELRVRRQHPIQHNDSITAVGAMWTAWVTGIDYEKNELSVVITNNTKDSVPWHEKWNLEHTKMGLKRREYVLTPTMRR